LTCYLAYAANHYRFTPRESSSRPGEVVLSHRAGVHLYARRLDGGVHHLRWDKILKA
jgi:hypothetical protein